MIPQASNQFPSMFTFLQSRADLSSLNYNASFVPAPVVFNPIPQYDSSQQCNNSSNVQPPADSIKTRLRPRISHQPIIKRIGRKHVVPILPKPENYDLQQQNGEVVNDSSEDAKNKRKRRIFVENRHGYAERKYAKYIKKSRKQGNNFKLNAQEEDIVIPKFELPKIEMIEKCKFTNKELSKMSFIEKINIKFCCSGCKTELPLCLFGVKSDGTPLNTCVRCCMKRSMTNPNMKENSELVKEYKEIIKMYNQELERIKKHYIDNNCNSDSPEETVVEVEEEEKKKGELASVQEEALRREKIQLLLQKTKELQHRNCRVKSSGYIPKIHYYRRRSGKPTEEELKKEKQIQDLLKQIVPLPKVNNNNNKSSSPPKEQQHEEEEDQQQELIQIPLPLPIQQFPSQNQQNSNQSLIDSQFTALTPIQPPQQQPQYLSQIPPQQQPIQYQPPQQPIQYQPPQQPIQYQPPQQHPQQQPIQSQHPQQQQQLQQLQQQQPIEEQPKRKRFPTCYKPEKSYKRKKIRDNIEGDSQVNEILRHIIPLPMTLPFLNNDIIQSLATRLAQQKQQRQSESPYYKVIVKQKVEVKDEATNTEESETMKIINAIKELDEKKAMKDKQNNEKLKEDNKQQPQELEIIEIKEEEEEKQDKDNQKEEEKKTESNKGSTILRFNKDKKSNDEINVECNKVIKGNIQHQIFKPNALKPKSFPTLVQAIPILLPLLPTLPLQPLPTTVISPPPAAITILPPPSQEQEEEQEQEQEQEGPIPLPPSPTLIEESYMPELNINPNFVDDGLIHLPPQVYSDLSPIETDIETF